MNATTGRVIAALAFATAAAGCTSESLRRSERLSLSAEPVRGGERTVVVDESGGRRRRVLVEVEPIARLPWDGRTLPLASPDGTMLATVVRSDLDWATRIGDPLPPEGFSARIESVAISGDAPGEAIAALEGPWVLGRSATSEGFLVERPRADGGRDIALAAWRGGVRTIAQDEWCNAFAVAAEDGTTAWSRRDPEAGDWQLVIERGGRRRVLPTSRGTGWLMPVLAGDGTGLFALRLDSTSLVAAWIPFGDDGMPAPDATRRPELVAAISLGANLTWAARAMEPVSGLSASAPGSDRLALWNPDTGRMLLWAPGGDVAALPAGSFAATAVGEADALVTLPGALMRQRIGNSDVAADLLAQAPWITRPTTRAASEFMAFRTDRPALEVARIVLLPDQDVAASDAPQGP